MAKLWLENNLRHPTSSLVRAPVACTAMSHRYKIEMNLLMHGVFEAIAATKFVRLSPFPDPPCSTHLLDLFINDTTQSHPCLLLPNLLLLVPVLDRYHDQMQF